MPEERKLVTILFADVTGSTALADTLDPEDVRALMSRYYDHARRVITPHGGTLEKFIGDAVMAIFGLTQAHEDDPERALAAALALREAVANDEILNPVFRLRMGVNTGEVIATANPDRLDFLVTGDAVNVSARLQQGANPGEIVVSQRTANTTRQSFLFAEPRLLQAKGKPQPLQIFPLQGKRQTRLIERYPFVGRAEDLRQLDALREHVLQERRSQVATIIGPAGTGKSRLLAEFLTHRRPEEGLRVASSGCLPYGETLTYWPLRGLLSELLGAPPDKDLIQSVYQQGGYDTVDASRLAGVIMTALGTREDETNKNKHTISPLPDPLPTGLKFELNNKEAMDLFTGMSKKTLAKLKRRDTWKNLNISNTLFGPGKPEPGMAKAARDFNFMDHLDDLDDLDDIDELVSVASSPELKDRETMQVFGERMRLRGEALKDAINESVYNTLREVVPSRFLATDRESLFTAWRLLIELLAQQAPRVIVFEDLHWASDPLLDLIEYIVQIPTEAPILFVVLSRPELLEHRTSWRAVRDHMTVMTLEPLGEAETRELIERVQAEVPMKIRQQIAERSGGNPFFTLELLRGYTERSQCGKLEVGLELPDTVHGAVLARLDLLFPQERSLLQAASVFKGIISRRWLAAITSEPGLDSALESLKLRDMLVALDEERYTFRHVLIRDVAYGTLARPERIRLHGQTALWLEQDRESQSAECECAELSAYHYRKAIELARQSAVPLELPFETTRAARSFERAGLSAGRSGAFSEASHYLQLAIDLTPHAEHARLYELLGESVSCGDPSFDAYQKALASWRADTTRQPHTGARLIRKLLIEGTRNSLFPRFTADEMETLRQEALTLLKGSEDEDERWRIRLTACFDPRVRSETNRPERLEQIKQRRELAQQAADYFEQRRYWEAYSEALDAYGVLAISSYALPVALATMQRRLTIPNLPIAEWADAVGSVICCLFLMGNYEGCIASVYETFANLKPGQPVARLGKVVSFGMLAAYLSGRWDEMERLLPRLDEIHELVQHDPTTPYQLARGYHAMLAMALAREDHQLVTTITAKLRLDAQSLGPFFSSIIDALIEDDVQKLSQELPTYLGDMHNMALILFANEHGYVLAEELLAHIKDIGESDRYLREIACALATNDLDRLAHAIDEAAAHQLEHHAARMRVILAERSCDPRPLAAAAPVLKRLGDRQFLHRLAKIAQTI